MYVKIYYDNRVVIKPDYIYVIMVEKKRENYE